MRFQFIRYSNWYYIFSGFLILVSIASLIVFGLKFGIEFTGGSNLEVDFTEKRPTHQEIANQLAEFNLGEITIQPTGELGAVLKFRGVDEITHQNLLVKLNELSPVREKSFQYIGPSIGQELKNRTVIAIIASLLAITLYITLAFRKSSKPVASWKYGLTSLIALFHDIIIPLGVFALLGRFYNVEITIPIIAALLTILGFSVHDTIVIFDRIRENILKGGTKSFVETVDNSLNQTLGRSMSTTFTVLIVMFALFIFGGSTLKYFALALIIGVTAGAYSSIFIASPLLVTWFNLSQKRI